ncbi:hypothetical protein ABZ402_50890 [Streptomyces mirabilis]|uniref:hypothetical protein n=1 Tax=Streptomyces mirabilis TaxID=68239 RepID=UPI0033E9CC4F
MILIGVDPHKSSHTAVAVDAAGHQIGQRRFGVNAGTFRQLMRWCEQWPERRFAVEGARGLGPSDHSTPLRSCCLFDLERWRSNADSRSGDPVVARA